MKHKAILVEEKPLNFYVRGELLINNPDPEYRYKCAIRAGWEMKRARAIRNGEEFNEEEPEYPPKYAYVECDDIDYDCEYEDFSIGVIEIDCFPYFVAKVHFPKFPNNDGIINDATIKVKKDDSFIEHCYGQNKTAMLYMALAQYYGFDKIYRTNRNNTIREEGLITLYPYSFGWHNGIQILVSCEGIEKSILLLDSEELKRRILLFIREYNYEELLSEKMRLWIYRLIEKVGYSQIGEDIQKYLNTKYCESLELYIDSEYTTKTLRRDLRGCLNYLRKHSIVGDSEENELFFVKFISKLISLSSCSRFNEQIIRYIYGN